MHVQIILKRIKLDFLAVTHVEKQIGLDKKKTANDN